MLGGCYGSLSISDIISPGRPGPPGIAPRPVPRSVPSFLWITFPRFRPGWKIIPIMQQNASCRRRSGARPERPPRMRQDGGCRFRGGGKGSDAFPPSSTLPGPPDGSHARDAPPPCKPLSSCSDRAKGGQWGTNYPAANRPSARFAACFAFHSAARSASRRFRVFSRVSRAFEAAPGSPSFCRKTKRLSVFVYMLQSPDSQCFAGFSAVHGRPPPAAAAGSRFFSRKLLSPPWCQEVFCPAQCASRSARASPAFSGRAKPCRCSGPPACTDRDNLRPRCPAQDAPAPFQQGLQQAPFFVRELAVIASACRLASRSGLSATRSTAAMGAAAP